MGNNLSKLLAIVGPTGSGKTAVGIDVAKSINGGVVSADSRQLYVGMNIGTATPLRSASYQPPPRLRPAGAGQEPHSASFPDIIGEVEHYLLNIREPDDKITLAEWQQFALAAIDQIMQREATPLLVGGTMLYVDSVLKNYDIPRVARNESLREELAKEDANALYDRLLRQDPAAKNFIEAHNKRRIVRALEVMQATGDPFSQQRQSRPAKYDTEVFGLFGGWTKLEQAMADRSRAMLDEGLVDEVERLMGRYGKDLPLLQTINYKQVLMMLDGELKEGELLEKMVRANMRYARRQMSWWRGRNEIRWFSSPTEMKKAIISDG